MARSSAMRSVPRKRKVNSLAYCAQEVLAAAEEMKEAAVGVSEQRKAKQSRQVFRPAKSWLFCGATPTSCSPRNCRSGPEFQALALARETAGTLRELASEMETEHFAAPGRSGTPAHGAGREIVRGAAGGNAR